MSHRHMHQNARPPRIPWQQFVARFEAEKTRLLKHYCERLKLWRQCPVARCRRYRTCSNELPFCTAWALCKLPEQARQAVVEVRHATPANIGAPERAARRLGLYDLSMADATADAVAEYLRHQNFPRIFTRAQREELRSGAFSIAAEMYTRPRQMLRFDFGSVTLDAELLNTQTAKAVRMLLPIIGTTVTCENGLYFQTGMMSFRDAHAEVIAYRAAAQAIDISFGQKPRTIGDGNSRARPCYIWLRAFAGVKTLEQVKEGTRVKVTGWLAPPQRGALTSLRRMLRREGRTPSARSKLHD